MHIYSTRYNFIGVLFYSPLINVRYNLTFSQDAIGGITNNLNLGLVKKTSFRLDLKN